MSRATFLSVLRNGRSLNDLTICQQDEVKSDGWKLVLDRELVYAEQIQPGGNGVALFGVQARPGDWVTLRGSGALPQVHSPSDFQRLFEWCGIYDGKSVYRRKQRVMAMKWCGDGVIRLYHSDRPDSAYQAVRPGDWIVKEETGGYSRVSREQGDLCFV